MRSAASRDKNIQSKKWIFCRKKEVKKCFAQKFFFNLWPQKVEKCKTSILLFLNSLWTEIQSFFLKQKSFKIDFCFNMLFIFFEKIVFSIQFQNMKKDFFSSACLFLFIKRKKEWRKKFQNGEKNFFLSIFRKSYISIILPYEVVL